MSKDKKITARTLLLRIKEQQSALKEYQEKVQSLNNEVKVLQRFRHEQEEQAARYKEQQEIATVKLQQSLKLLLQSKKNIQRLKSTISELKSELQTQSLQLEEYKTSSLALDDLTKTIDDLTHREQELQNTLAALESKQHSQTQKISTKLKGLRTKFNSLSDLLLESQNHNQELQNLLEASQSQTAELHHQLNLKSLSHDEQEKLQLKIKDLEDQVNILKASWEQEKVGREQAETLLGETQTQLNTSHTNILTLTEQLQEAEAKIIQAQSDTLQGENWELRYFDLEEKLTQLQKVAQETSQERDNLLLGLDRLQQQLSDSETTVHHLSLQLQQQEQSLEDSQQLAKDYAALELKAQKAQAHLIENEQHYQVTLERTKNSLQKEIQLLIQQRSSLEQKLQEQEEELLKAQAMNDVHIAKEQQLEAEFSRLKHKETLLMKELEEKSSKIEELETQLSQKENRPRRTLHPSRAIDISPLNFSIEDTMEDNLEAVQSEDKGLVFPEFSSIESPQPKAPTPPKDPRKSSLFFEEEETFDQSGVSIKRPRL